VRNHTFALALAPALLAGSVLPSPSAAEEMPHWADVRVDAGRIERRILELARFGRNEHRDHEQE
jgi:hypothetical protein